MKRNISILSALLCLAFLFVSCVNPTQSESGSKPKSGGGGGTIGGGTEEEIVEDSPHGDKYFEFVIEDDESDETPTISASKADASADAVTLATAKLPKDGGPWDAKLVEPTEQINNTARINLSEGSIDSPFEVGVDDEKSELYVKLKKGKKLNAGLYSINLVIKGANGIPIYKTFTFEVLSPDPTPTANDFDVKFEGAGERDGIPTISEATLDASAGSVTLATLTPPKKGGPWSVELDDEPNALFGIEDGDVGNDFVRIVLNQGQSLGWGRYSINLVIKSAEGITIYKTFTFDVVLTPAPFTKTPSVYPYITGFEKNKLSVSWAAPSGATKGFRVYAGTALARPENPVAVKIPVKESGVITGYTDQAGNIPQNTTEVEIWEIGGNGGLPNGTKYYVWVEAVNDGGSSFSDPAERTTSYDIDDFFYYYIEPGTRKIMYSWDSFTGGGGGIDCYRILAPVPDNPGTLENEYTPARMLYGRVAAGIGTTGWTAEIVYFDKFPDGKDENGNYLRPDGTRTGRLEESLLDEQENETPAGVFIVKYDNPYGERIYQGVYYYGRGATQTKETNASRNNQTICYFGNSYYLPSGPNPETATLPQAIDRFTLANMKRFIAFIAVPWYRCYGYENNPDSQQVAPE